MNFNHLTWQGFHPKDPAQVALKRFFILDIQSKDDLNELQQKLAKVVSGESHLWMRSGQAYHLEIHPHHIELEDLFTHDFYQMPMHVLELALMSAKGW